MINYTSLFCSEVTENVMLVECKIECLTFFLGALYHFQMYKHSNNKTMTTGAIAAMLSTILYSRRFFPYYVYNIIGGLDEEGKTSNKKRKKGRLNFFERIALLLHLRCADRVMKFVFLFLTPAFRHDNTCTGQVHIMHPTCFLVSTTNLIFCF